MSISFDNSKNYLEPKISSTIPPELESSNIILPVSSEVHSQEVKSTTASISNGGSSYIYLPVSQNQVIKPGSCYLNMSVSITTGSTGGTGNFNNPLRDASALIDRVTFYVGSETTSLVNNYGFVNDMILLNRCSSNWINTQGSAALMTQNNSADNNTPFLAYSAGATTSSVGSFSIPLHVGALNGSEQGFPLYLMQSMPYLQIDFQSNLSKVYYTTGTQIASYSVSNITLCYESITVSDAYCNMVRESLKNGGLFLLKSVECQSLLTGVSTAFSILYALGLKSLRAIAYTFLPATFANDTRNVFSANGVNMPSFYLNGSSLVNQLTQLNIATNASKVFLESRKAWASFMDADASYGAIISSANNLCLNDQSNPYITTYFTGGVNTALYRDGCGFGSGSSNLSNLRFDVGSCTAAANLLLLAMYDQVLEISSGGVVRKLV